MLTNAVGVVGSSPENTSVGDMVTEICSETQCGLWTNELHQLILKAQVCI